MVYPLSILDDGVSMAQIRVPIVSGVTTTPDGDFLTSYPVNREPVLRDTGISEGYLRAPYGITQATEGAGTDRGGIAWNGEAYRVQGTSLVRVNANWTVDVLGDVGAGGLCSLDYSFTDLIVGSGGRLYYWNVSDGLRQVTDSNLGTVNDLVYVDGYTMTTDGEYIVVNNLGDPFTINPLRYGSAEEDPDPNTGLGHMHGEVYVFGRFTIQPFQNIGGTGFPFQAVKSGTVPYGCVGARAKCKYVGTYAFVGGARGSTVGVYLMGAGDADKISSAEVDAELAALSDEDLAAVWLESRVEADDQRLILHLPARSWGFSAQVSRKSQIKCWNQYVSGTTNTGGYQGRGLTYCYGKWIVAASDGRIGYLDTGTAKHFGSYVMWQFDTPLLYNDANRAILTGIELVGTPGRGSQGRVFWSYTKDGQVWSVEQATSTGSSGQTRKRPAWRPGVRFEVYMGLRFRGVDDSLAAFNRLECDIEALGA